MRLALPTVLAFLPFAAACQGRVKVEEIDRFGRVDSAVWVHAAAREQESDYIVLSTTGGYCPKLQKAYDEVNGVLEDWFSSVYEQGDLEGFCADGEDVLAQLHDAARKLADAGDHQLSFALADMAANSLEPQQETYYTDDDKWLVAGVLTYFQDDYYGVYLDTWDEDDCVANVGIGWNDNALDDAADEWTFTDGRLEVTDLSGDSLKAEFDGYLTDERDHDDGAIEGHFSAQRCDIDVNDDYLWL